MTGQTPGQLLNSLGQYQGRSATLGKTLGEVLKAQRDLYLQLTALAKQQSQFIAEGASEGLMTVLAARSRIIEQLTPLDQQLRPYKDRWQGVLDGLAAEDRGNVSMLLTQVQQLLADILERDEADRQILVRQKESVGAQISRTVTGNQLNRAYGVKKNGAAGMGIG
jgi:hypothetical protein